MCISLRLATPPSPAPSLRRPPKPRAGSTAINAIAIAIAPVASLPPRALRSGELRVGRRVCGASSSGGAAAETPPVAACRRTSAPRRCDGYPSEPPTLLMLARGTAIQKSFLVPFVALQAPSSVISWIEGDYGQWTAFLALLMRLLYFIPGELELPLSTMLLVSIARYELMNLRGSEDSAILSLAISIYLALQHFTGAGGARKAFDCGAIVATLSIICITLVSLMFMF